jgi:hypothetical protein
MQKTTAILVPKETLKTTGRWHKKVGEQNKAGINLKYRTLACKQYPYNTFLPQDQQEEKSIRQLPARR